MSTSPYTVSNHTYGAVQNTIWHLPAVQPKMQFSPSLTDVAVMFFGTENNTRIVAKFSAEYDLSASENCKIQILIQALMQGISVVDPIAYIRNHGLERHFKFAIA